MVRAVLAILAAQLLLSCASTKPLPPTIRVVDQPRASDAAVAGLGDVILRKGRSQTYPSVVLAGRLTWFDLIMLRQFEIAPGTLVAREDDRDFTY